MICFEEIVDQYKKIHDLILQFLEDENDSSNDEYTIKDIIKSLESPRKDDKNPILENPESFHKILEMISNISENHFRHRYFITKVQQILFHLQDKIKQTYSNISIFKIFKKNILILNFFIENKIITFDEAFTTFLKQEFLIDDDVNKFVIFQHQELIQNEGFDEMIRKYFSEKNLNIPENDEKIRQIGENESYICSLIRQDSIEEFISFINQKNFLISSKINFSIYETNSFLIKKEPTLIEYAAFFGSIRVLKYLYLNKVDLTPSLWIYGIHSNNAELIQFLIENNVEPEDKTYCKCLLESIKCHHNDIADYIQNNLLVNDGQSNIDEGIVKYSLKYSNYSYFPSDWFKNDAFFYSCYYDYPELINIFMTITQLDKNLKMIQFYFFMRQFKI